MSWIRCKCDYIIYDNTDYIPYKAHIISDKEKYDLFEMVSDLINSKYSNKEELVDEFYSKVGTIPECVIRLKTTFQCPQCGRIYIENKKGNEFCVFVPENHEEKNLYDFEGDMEFSISSYEESSEASSLKDYISEANDVNHISIAQMSELKAYILKNME